MKKITKKQRLQNIFCALTEWGYLDKRIRVNGIRKNGKRHNDIIRIQIYPAKYPPCEKCGSMLYEL